MSHAKRVLVTGGAGFIGSHVTIELIGYGYEPVIVDNFSNSHKGILRNIERLAKRQINCYDVDYQNQKRLGEIIKKHNIQNVIHFAAYKAVGESVSYPLKYYKNNVSGLIAFLETLEKLGVKNLVFSSSCTVYGNEAPVPVSEKMPIGLPESPYGSTKQMAEQVIRDVCRASTSLKAMLLRYFNPIGAHPSGLIGELPQGTPNCLVPYLTQSVARLRDPLTIYGDDYNTPDGTCIRDYIHVCDLAEAHVKALKFLDNQSPQYIDAFNIGNGKGVSVLELVKAFEKINNLKVPYVIGDRRQGDVETIYANTEKSKKALGWSPHRSLDEALKDAWNWQKTIMQGVWSE